MTVGQMRYRYKVMKTKYVNLGEVVHIYTIVVKDVQTDMVVLFTEFADYILYKVPRDISIFDTTENAVYGVCDFLNYLFFDECLIRHIRETTREMAEKYLDCYVDGRRSPGGDMPARNAIHFRRHVISLFLETLAYYGQIDHIFVGDLMYKREYIVTKTGEKRIGYTYTLTVRYKKQDSHELQQLMRDMPLEIAQRFIDMAQVYDPELALPLVLMLYVGLRGGDVCNIYRGIKGKHQGILVSSTSYDDANGQKKYIAESMEICLLYEINLRSDSAAQGQIKCERIQPVFKPFLDTVMSFYAYHKSLIKNKECETINGIRPLFLNRNKDARKGVYMAMTISGLRDRINTLYYKKVLPSCKDDPNPNLARYYLQMQQGHTWGKHAFRHFYTVLLLYCGVDDPVMLKVYRGDGSTRSAETYIRNKGVLLDLYKKTLDQIGEMVLPKEESK